MSNRINKKKLRKALAAMEIFRLTDLARLIPCSAWAVHAACKNPKRAPKVRARIKELTDV